MSSLRSKLNDIVSELQNYKHEDKQMQIFVIQNRLNKSASDYALQLSEKLNSITSINVQKTIKEISKL